jgi:hypothetical protein
VVTFWRAPKVYQRAGKREPAGENLATAATIY